MKKLISFCEKKTINIKNVDYKNNTFNIENFGNFMFLEKEKLLDEEFQLSLSKEEVSLTKSLNIDFYCYSFGGVFYYTSVNKTEFLVFDFIGKSKIDDSVFCNLGVHAEYESLNGAGTYDLWIQKANFLNHKKLGICEKNTLAGILPFQLECEKKKLDAVIGETITVCINKKLYDFKIYCKDEIGWRNCLKINSYINVDNVEEKNIPFLELLKYSKGLFLIIPNSLMSLENREIVTIIKSLRSKFEYLYFQIDSVIFDDEKIQLNYFQNIKKYLNEFSDIVEPILINDSYYLNSDDWECKSYLNEIGKFKFIKSKNQHFKTSFEVLNIFSPYFTEKKFKIGYNFKSVIELAIQNTNKLSNLCIFKIQTGKHKLPKYRNTFNISNDELFDKLIEEGLHKKVPLEKHEQYIERWNTESKVIKMAGFVDYFLILWDIVFWAKNNDILVGVGRGSVGGCLIAYLLDIITIDPIEHDLLFERFLNESRVMGDKYFKIELENGEILKIKEGAEIKMKNGQCKLVENLIESDDIDVGSTIIKIKSITDYRVTRGDQTPDIDIDFESARRDDIKKYMEQRFGKNNVVSAGSYGRLKLKSSLKDFSKVAGLSFQYVNEITSLIPNKQDDFEWYELFELAQKNKKLYDFVQENVHLINIIQKCMFQTRAASIHPSAVVIVPDEDEFGNKMEVFDFMPVKLVDGMLVSEWEGKYLERAGFLKEDILGISQLDKLKSIIKLIEKNHNQKIVLENIPLDDEKVYELFQKGLNEDVFQFGTFGIKSFCKGVKPENIGELTSINALYRPGPMKANAHKDFIDIKFDKKEAKYDYGLKSVTESTYGLYIYQEQIMKSVSVLGGLSLNQADEVRTIMKKFDKEKMALFKEKFIKGAIEKGCGEYEANEIWQKLNNFSSYGFNKSHSAAYSIIGYYCQYLKYYFPLEFYTTALHFCNDDVITVSEVLNEIPLVSDIITVAQPCINTSNFNFTGKSDKIYWSLTKIKYVGVEIVKQIIDERNKNGAFYSISEFIARVGSKVNKRALQNLIFAGAFDNVYEIRNLRDRIEIFKELKTVKKDVELPDFNDFQFSIQQREITGYNFSAKTDLAKVLKIKDPQLHKIYLEPEQFLSRKKLKNDLVSCIGFIESYKERESKNGNFCNIVINSNNQKINILVWNDVWNSLKDKMVERLKSNPNTVLIISGLMKFDEFKNVNILQTCKNSTVYLINLS